VLSRRPTRDADQTERTRSALLEATRKLIADGGAFAGLSVGDIASAAGVSRPTFYAYFRDKRDLVLALGAEMERDMRAAADPWLRGGQGVLRETLDAVLDGFRRHQSAVLAIVEAATYDEEVAAFWRSFHEYFIESGAKRAQRADPAMSDEDARAIAFTLVWMTERSLTEHLSAPRVSDPALLDANERLWRSVVGPDDDR
jgi:AcrR family transcriptional regulator